MQIVCERRKLKRRDAVAELATIGRNVLLATGIQNNSNAEHSKAKKTLGRGFPQSVKEGSSSPTINAKSFYKLYKINSIRRLSSHA
jgi:hypothetical protein